MLASSLIISANVMGSSDRTEGCRGSSTRGDSGGGPGGEGERVAGGGRGEAESESCWFGMSLILFGTVMSKISFLQK